MWNPRRWPVTALSAALLVVSSTLFAAEMMHPTLTRDDGAPVGDNQNSQTAGPNGPVLLQDVHLLEKFQRFDRERIPERVVHARGTGAYGEFVSAGDFSALTKAKLLSAPGKKTPAFARFSTVMGGNGSPETVRDPRGFAIKLYTEEGNWDMVGNHMPVFFIRDAIKFPDFVHSFKPSPVTNVQEPERMFDFLSNAPESTHMVTRLYSREGIPASYRSVDSFTVNAFKFVNAKGDVHYVKFHWKARLPYRGYSSEEAAKVKGTDTENLTNDLYGALKTGDHPKWDLMAQIVEPRELARFDFDPLDATKIWPGIPETRLGTLTLNQIPGNFFEHTEQSAHSPSRMPPGVEASEDRMLQGRLFAYPDTQIHRLGPNYQQLPVNRPLAEVRSNNQAGSGDQALRTSDVNYEPSNQTGTPRDNPAYKWTPTPLTGTTQQRPIVKQALFRQAGDYYRALHEKEKVELVGNLAADLNRVTSTESRQRMISYFYRADPDYGRRVAAATRSDLDDVKQRAAKLED
ncbi:MAG: catalase [Pararobbsia sp.]